MKTRLLVFSLLFISSFYACQSEDDSMSATVISSDRGRVEFTAVFCTDLEQDPVCTGSFSSLSSVRIFVYETAENREFADPILATLTTDAEGFARLINLKAGKYYFRADSPLSEEFIEDSFSAMNTSIAKVRLEYQEE